MAGTRTAGDVSGAANSRRLSWRMIDANGQKRSDSLIVPPGATNLELEALMDAIAAATNTSIYEISVSDIFSGVVSANNADPALRISGDDIVTFSMKDSGQKLSRQLRVRAPLTSLFDVDSESLDVTNPLILAVKAAADAVGGTFVTSTVRFTEHRDINEAESL